MTSPEQHVTANGSPYELGSVDDRIWQNGYRAGYKSEREAWRHFSGCKYPQDIPQRFSDAAALVASLRAEVARLAWFEDDWKIREGAKEQEDNDAENHLTEPEMQMWEDARRGDTRSFARRVTAYVDVLMNNVSATESRLRAEVAALTEQVERLGRQLDYSSDQTDRARKMAANLTTEGAQDQ